MMWNADYISYKGNTNFIRAYQGEELVWERFKSWTDEPFWIENINDYPILFFVREGCIIRNRMDYRSGDILFSFDKENWEGVHDIHYQGQVTIPPHTKMWLINDTDGIDFEAHPTDLSHIYNLFNILNVQGSWDESNFAEFNVGGNLHSIVYNWNDKVRNAITDYAFMGIFSRMKVVDASQLLLPSINLTTGCYRGMFDGCRSLTKAPVLPPKLHLGSYSCEDMFMGCDSLIKAPILDISSIQGEYSCFNMFEYCISLKTCKINVEHIGRYSFNSMFYYCQGLESVEINSVKSVGFGGCERMFYNCTSLKKAPKISATSLERSSYDAMFYNCTSLIDASEMTLLQDRNIRIPLGCYYDMFFNCTSLNKAPKILSYYANYNSLWSMFGNCVNLKEIVCLLDNNDIETNTSTQGWVEHIPTGGKFYKNPNTEWGVGDNGIPRGWEVIDYIE